MARSRRQLRQALRTIPNDHPKRSRQGVLPQQGRHVEGQSESGAQEERVGQKTQGQRWWSDTGHSLLGKGGSPE
jgi:hypothetical protein